MHLLLKKDFHAWCIYQENALLACMHRWVNLHKPLCVSSSNKSCVLCARREAEKVPPIFTRAFFFPLGVISKVGRTLCSTSRSRRALHRVTDDERKKVDYSINAVAFRLSSSARNFTRIAERASGPLFALADWHMRRASVKIQFGLTGWRAGGRPLSISALSHSRPTFVANVPYLLPPTAPAPRKKMREDLEI